MSTKHHKKPGEEENSIASTLLNSVAYAGAAIAGGYVADLEIKNAAYRNLARHRDEAGRGIFDAIQDKRNANMLAVLKVATPANSSESRQEMVKIVEEYRQDVRKIFESKGLMNNWHYKDLMTSNQKAKTFFEAITVAGITLGALLTIANAQGWKKYFSHEEDRERSR